MFLLCHCLQETLVPVPYKLMKLADGTAAESATVNQTHIDDAVAGPSQPTTRPNRFTKVTINQCDNIPAESQPTAQ